MNNENDQNQPSAFPPNPNNQINPLPTNPNPPDAVNVSSNPNSTIPIQNVDAQQPQFQSEPIQPMDPQPQSTAPVVLSDSLNQPQTTPEQSHSHHNTNNKHDNEYNSNPFVVAGKGLGSALVENPTSAILIALIPVIVIFPALFIVGVVAGLLSLAGGAVGALLGGLFGLVVIIVMALLLIRVAAGSLNIVLKSIDKEKISTKEALGSVSSGSLTSFVVANLLTFIAVFIGLLFFIIPGIYILARLSLAPVIVYAEDKKAMAALKRSMALTKGHVFEMLGALSAQSILSGNGLLSTIGASSGVVKRYKELTTAENSGITDTGKVHWLNYVVPVMTAIFLIGYIGISIFSSMIEQNNNNFNDFNNDSYINDDFRYDDSDFNSDFNSQFELDNSDPYDYSN